MMRTTVPTARTTAVVSGIRGAGSVGFPLMCRNVSTQNTKVATSIPMTVWLTRSLMNERITRGENWLLASWRLTTVNEKTTPAVVIVAPATVLSSHVAPLLFICTPKPAGPSSSRARSRYAVASASATPATTSTVGNANKLSRKR